MRSLAADIEAVCRSPLGFDVTSRVASLEADLVARLGEPHRHYHDLTHVTEMLTVLDGFVAAGVLSPPEAAVARLAAWFHDAVYDPASSGNEAVSAELARTVLPSLGVPAEVVASVVELVLDTVDHALPRPDSPAACFHDADLWILSAPPERFDAYCAQVRAEYAAVPDAAYSLGRTAILTALTGRDRLYATSHAHHSWTPSARANVTRELARLARPR